MVWTCAVGTKRFAFCAELNVRFLFPVRPNAALLACGELVSNRRDKLFAAKARLQNQAGVVLATASGKCLLIQPPRAAEMETDFVEDPTWVLGP